MRIYLRICLCLNLLAFTLPLMVEPTIAERFAGKQKLTYQVFFNGGKSGNVTWQYLGRESLGVKEADVLRIDSDTKIMGFFDLTSHEKIYLDVNGSLPIKVERDLVVFGRKEMIKEYYDQDKGLIDIVKTTGDKKEQRQLLHQAAPIRHIMALLYFFPSVDTLKKGEVLRFNLPTCKVEVKRQSLRKVEVNGKSREAYLLVGTGGRRFNLWIDKEKNYPVRIEFLFPAGKVSIVESAN